MVYFFVAVGLIMVATIAYTTIVNNKIKKEGIEKEGVVCAIDESESYDEEGGITTSYTYYVNYVNEQGEKVTAMIRNPKSKLREGSKIKLKYLKEKPKYVVMIEILEI